jgi:ParB family chromosome partitioning protein
MSQKRRSGLGKGLGSIFNERVKDKKQASATDIFFGKHTTTKNELHENNKENFYTIDSSADIGAKYLELDINKIETNPYQPRKEFDQEYIDELSDSIKSVGLLQPIIVRTHHNKYQLVMGERRLRAAKHAGLKQIPAIIKETKNEEMLKNALIENIHRVDLNPIEEAASYKQMIDDFGATHDEIAKQISKSRAYITNTIRLLNLPTLVQKLVIDNKISAGHARPLLSLIKKDSIIWLANQITKKHLSVREVEKLATLKSISEMDLALGNKRKTSAKFIQGEKGEYILYLENSIGDKLDTNVKIDIGKQKSTLKIEFASIDDLNRILEIARLK